MHAPKPLNCTINNHWSHDIELNSEQVVYKMGYSSLFLEDSRHGIDINIAALSRSLAPHQLKYVHIDWDSQGIVTDWI